MSFSPRLDIAVNGFGNILEFVFSEFIIGVFGEEIVFRRVNSPTKAELVQLIERIVKRLLRLLIHDACHNLFE